jgi:hypothetical protein
MRAEILMATGACAFSDELIASLEAMGDEERASWVEVLRGKRRYLDVYQVLVLALGFTGLHALYLRNWLGFLLRIVLAATTGALCVYGFLEVDFDLVAAAGGVVALMALLWLFDYLSAARSVRRYHLRVEKKAVRFLSARAERRAARKAKALARAQAEGASPNELAAAPVAAPVPAAAVAEPAALPQSKLPPPPRPRRANPFAPDVPPPPPQPRRREDGDS